MPFSPNTWYVVTLKVDRVGGATADIWQRDNPAVRTTRSFAMPAGLRYRFYHQTAGGTDWVDNYSELNYQSTSYTYDARDNLTRVTDALGTTTVITYDGFGLKTGMHDPDMGVWGYGYDPGGNLQWQQDAKGQRVSFEYDRLNRLVTRWQGDTGTGKVLAQYGYDAGPRGIGQRTFAAGGPRLTFQDVFTQVSASDWTPSGSGSVSVESQTLKAVSSGAAAAAVVERDLTLDPAQGSLAVQTEFKLAASTHWSLNALVGVGSANTRVGVFANESVVGIQWNPDGTGWSSQTLLSPVKPNTWYVTTLRMMPAGAAQVEVWERDNPAARASYAVKMKANLQWKFHHDTLTGTTWLDNYQEAGEENTASWQYDNRGRPYQAYRSIDGRTYGMAYQYDAADRVIRTAYPNGEWVTATYNTAGQPYGLTGWNTYVVSTTYNALGQVYRMRFDNGREARYTYYGLDTYAQWQNRSWGRLRRMCVISQTASGSCGDANQTPILDLAYEYDAAGNIDVIDDVQNNSQRQSFAYDALDRLVSAGTTAAGNGRYTEVYTYTAVGNFVSKGGVTQWYSDTAHKHAVTGLSNGATFVYDDNGNPSAGSGQALMQRVEISGSQRITYSHAWDIDNRTTAVFSDTYAVHYTTDADGGRVAKIEYTNGAATLTDTFNTRDTARWTFSPSTTVPFSEAGTTNTVLWLSADAGFQETYRSAYALSTGESASVDFRVNVTHTDTQLYLMLEADRGLATHSRLALLVANNKLSVQTRSNGGTPTYPKDLVSALKTYTWYRLTLRVDDVNGFRLELREREACNLASTTCAAVYSQRMPAGKSWRFATAIYDSFVWLDNYVERADGVERTNYVGGVFEHNPATNRGTSYYAFGSGPVAMRVMTGVITASVVTWLHGDHLGSASLTTNASGQRVSELRYKPFGEPRWVWGVTATDKRFTGQEEQAGLGSLYDYHARMYSPALGRFLSADTIVPEPGRPQAHNRYAYVYNGPLALIDPAGHCGTTPAGQPVCDSSSSTQSALTVAPVSFGPSPTYMEAPTHSSGPTYAILEFMMPGYIETRSKVYSQISLSEIALATGADFGPLRGGVESANVTACRGDTCRTYNEVKVSAGAKVGVPVLGNAELGAQWSGKDFGSLGAGQPYLQVRAGADYAGVSAKLTPYSLEAKARFVNGGVGAGIAWQVETRKLMAVPQSALQGLDTQALGKQYFGSDYRFVRVSYSSIDLNWSGVLGMYWFSTVDSPMIVVNEVVE